MRTLCSSLTGMGAGHCLAHAAFAVVVLSLAILAPCSSAQGSSPSSILDARDAQGLTALIVAAMSADLPSVEVPLTPAP